MADISEFRKRTQEMREALLQRLPEIAETLALSAKALSEREIKERGFGAMYSPVKYPAFFLHGKELNQRGTKFLENHGVNPFDGTQGKGKKKRRKSKEDADPGNYDTLTNWSEFRAAQGLQIAHTDLTYTGKMWANMAPVRTEQTEAGVFAAFLGATNREAQKEMNYNFDRYGDFVRKGITDENGKLLGNLVISELERFLETFKF